MDVTKENGRRRRANQPVVKPVEAEPVVVAAEPVAEVPAEIVYIIPDEVEVEVPGGVGVRTQDMIRNWGPIGVWYRPGDEPKG